MVPPHTVCGHVLDDLSLSCSQLLLLRVDMVYMVGEEEGQAAVEEEEEEEVVVEEEEEVQEL